MSNESKGDSLFVDVKPPASKPKAAPAVPKAKDVRRRWIYLGVGFMVFAVVASSMFHSTPPVPQKKEEVGALVNVTPKNVDEKSWQVRSQADIKNVENQNSQLQNQIKALQDQLTALKNNPAPAQAALPPGVVAPPSQTHSDITSSHSSVVPPPPVPSQSVSTTALSQPGLPRSLSHGLTGDRSASDLPAIPPPYTSAAPASVEPMVFTPDKSAAPAAAATGADDAVDAKVRYKKNAQSGMMVAGAFAPVVLLNGIDAGTSSGSRSNPLPVLIRVQDNAVLPGASKYQLKSCFLLGSGYGELSSERVYIRLARLSCIDRTDRLVLSVPVQGYIVDSDNTLGMRGKVVDRQGARLGKAMLAGFAQGLSGALGGAQGTVTTSALGAATSITGTEALRASGLSGVSSASSQLAQFYLKEAEAIFPVIEVDGGRTASVVFTDDVNLAWGNVDAQFVRDVEPTNSNKF